MSGGRIFTLVILAIALALAPGASAFAEDGFYAGVGVGQATIEIDDSDIDFDQDDFGWKAFAGYRFMPYFGTNESARKRNASTRRSGHGATPRRN